MSNNEKSQDHYAEFFEEAMYVIQTNQNFKSLVEETLKNKDFVENFCRLTNVKSIFRPKSNKSDPVIRFIDENLPVPQETTEEFFKTFIPFVYDTVWLRMIFDTLPQKPL